MFSNFEVRKTASVILCTVLFSTTCVLSAVGPARASEASTVKLVATSTTLSAPLA